MDELEIDTHRRTSLGTTLSAAAKVNRLSIRQNINSIATVHQFIDQVKMVRFACLVSVVFLATARAFVPHATRPVARHLNNPLKMAIDYNDPMVAEEFAMVQPMEYDDVAAELQTKGIRVPPTMK